MGGAVRASPPDATGYVVWVEPEDGAEGVFCDPVVLVRLSHPVDPESLFHFRVCDRAEPVPGRLEISPDRRVLIWRPERRLRPGAEHVIGLTGLRDRRGQPLPGLRSRFICGTLAHADLADLLPLRALDSHP